jgi:hypothetical protein
MEGFGSVSQGCIVRGQKAGDKDGDVRSLFFQEGSARRDQQMPGRDGREEQVRARSVRAKP